MAASDIVRQPGSASRVYRNVYSSSIFAAGDDDFIEKKRTMEKKRAKPFSRCAPVDEAKPESDAEKKPHGPHRTNTRTSEKTHKQPRGFPFSMFEVVYRSVGSKEAESLTVLA